MGNQSFLHEIIKQQTFIFIPRMAEIDFHQKLKTFELNLKISQNKSCVS
jgi:hypothetical protein